jgi:hypothetical protein
MARFQVGDTVVHVDEPTVRGRIVEIRRAEDPAEYQVRWSNRSALALLAESALLHAYEPDDLPGDLDEHELEDEAGSLE